MLVHNPFTSPRRCHFTGYAGRVGGCFGEDRVTESGLGWRRWLLRVVYPDHEPHDHYMIMTLATSQPSIIRMLWTCVRGLSPAGRFAYSMEGPLQLVEEDEVSFSCLRFTRLLNCYKETFFDITIPGYRKKCHSHSPDTTLRSFLLRCHHGTYFGISWPLSSQSQVDLSYGKCGS
jgi:hypothetical protein